VNQTRVHALTGQLSLTYGQSPEPRYRRPISTFANLDPFVLTPTLVARCARICGGMVLKVHASSARRAASRVERFGKLVGFDRSG